MQNFSRILSVCYLTFAVISLLLVGNTYATNTFEDQKGRFAIDLPGGWKLVGPFIKPGLTFYRGKFVKPGERLGMSYDGLVHVNGRWVWVPKPYKFLGK